MSVEAPASIDAVPVRSSARGFMLTGSVMLAALAFVAVAAPFIAPHDPEAVEVSRVLGAPDLAHLFGSDVLGRDVLSRVIYALRVSLLVAISAVAASLVIAVPLGLSGRLFRQLGGHLDFTHCRHDPGAAGDAPGDNLHRHFGTRQRGSDHRHRRHLSADTRPRHAHQHVGGDAQRLCRRLARPRREPSARHRPACRAECARARSSCRPRCYAPSRCSWKRD